MNNARFRPLWRQTLSAALAAALLLPAAVPALAAEAPAQAATGTNAARVQEVLELLEQNHVSVPDGGKLAEAAIEGMLGTLNDPFTDYFTAEELKQFTNSLENIYVGIGVRISFDEKGVYIDEVFEGSPAKEAGMMQGDLITAVEGQSVVGLPLGEVTPKILGIPDTKVKVTVLSDGVSKELTMPRRQVQIPNVVRKWFEPGVGYIKISSFSSDADERMSLELAALKFQGMKSLIVDLRDNPGGLLDTAVNMAKLFVKEGVIIHTKNRSNQDEPVKITGGTTQNVPVYFLVNENSASASEVLTGALQDYGAIHVVGTKTYGKGSVQNLFELKNGGAIKITIEEYLTPKQRKVDKVGLQPDIAVEGQVPQLLEALRLAGVEKLDLTLDRGTLSVNGVKVTDAFQVVREGGATLVPARVLAELVGGEAVWDEASRSVQIVAKDGSATYAPKEGGWLLRGGTSYVNVSDVQGVFGQLNWFDDGKKLILSGK